jgi:hypothetical protein
VLELVSPELRPFIGVGALALLFLAAASLIHRYRAWQAERLVRAQRLLRAADRLERVLMHLQGAPLPRELLEWCKQDLLSRYRQVQELFPKLQELEERIQAAERMRSDAGTAAWEAPQMHSAAELRHYARGLTALVEFLSPGAPGAQASSARARELRERLRTLRADAQAAYHTRTALEMAEAGHWDRAQAEALQLIGLLKAKAPPNERGKALYRSAVALYQDLMYRRLPSPDQRPGVAA